VTTMQIYKGAIPFLVLQLSMVAILIAFPGMVTGNLDKKVDVDMKAVGEQMLEQLQQNDSMGLGDENPLEGGLPAPGSDTSAPADADGSANAAEDDPVKALEKAAGK